LKTQRNESIPEVEIITHECERNTVESVKYEIKSIEEYLKCLIKTKMKERNVEKRRRTVENSKQEMTKILAKHLKP
jgi:hypothetical protein